MKNWLSGWSLYERLWLCLFTLIALIVNLLSGESPFGLLVFLSGVLCVILAAKGSLLNYPVGMLNTLGYAWLSYQNGLYGEMGLNLFFFVPMNLAGLFLWRRHMQGGAVRMRRMHLPAVLLAALGCAGGILAMGFGLSCIPGQNSPYIDAATNVLSVAATILMVRRYREQWFAYLALNAFTVFMWALRTAAGSPEGPLMLVMWSAYLINAVYGLRVWSRGAAAAQAQPTVTEG